MLLIGQIARFGASSLGRLGSENNIFTGFMIFLGFLVLSVRLGFSRTDRVLPYRNVIIGEIILSMVAASLAVNHLSYVVLDYIPLIPPNTVIHFLAVLTAIVLVFISGNRAAGNRKISQIRKFWLR